MIDDDVDILIIGGGLIGAALMLALANKGYRILLVEAQAFSTCLEADFDARTLALSPASVCILKTLGIWTLLDKKATPIKTIHVSEQGRFATARLEEQSDDPLGYVLELQTIYQALHQRLPPEALLAPARLIALDKTQGLATIQCANEQRQIKAGLIVAADGGQSTVRRLLALPVQFKDYEQQALIANIGLNRSHHNIAYERFTSTGPLAMLPMTDQRAALVWCLPPALARDYLVMDESLFLKRLQQTFGYKLGRFIKVGQRSTFPLRQMLMPEQVDWPVVFIGNAAHTLHPVAGQGFNLGLRDVAALAQCIIQQGIHPDMLIAYQAMRQSDQRTIARLTHGLVRIFGSQLPGMAWGRGLGMMVMDNTPYLKSLLSLYAGGYAGILPDLVCGIRLDKETY